MTPAEKNLALKDELLIDPAVPAPGPDLSPIKLLYRTMIETTIRDWNAAHPVGPIMSYGPQTDQVISDFLARIETGVRAVDVTADVLRQPLLRASWGKIALVAAQVPEYYGLPVVAADAPPLLARTQPEVPKPAPTAPKAKADPRAPAATPILNSLVPDTARAGDPDFVIHYHGRDFIDVGIDKSIAHWDGVAVPTTFVSTTELTSLVRSTLEPLAKTCQIHINSGGRLSAPLPFAYTNPAPTLDTKIQRNIYCRNMMILLQDPAVVHHGENYNTLHATLEKLVTETLLTQAEMTEILLLMRGGPVTNAYNKGLVDLPTETATPAEISAALRVA